MVSGDDGMQLRKAPGSKYYGNIFRRHYICLLYTSRMAMLTR